MRRTLPINLIREQTLNEEIDYNLVYSCLKTYKAPRDVITRLLNQKDLIRVKKGLYVFGEHYQRWYDLVWFVRKKIPLNLEHLEIRMMQSEHLKKQEKLTDKLLFQKLDAKINELDIDNALLDIRPHVADASVLDNWSKAYFKEIASNIVIG